MASIGVLPVLFLKGGVDVPGEQSETIERQGFDGLAYRQIGKWGREFKLESWAEAVDTANVILIQKNLKLLQGTIVDFTLDNGIPYVNAMVIDVFNQPPMAIRNATGGLFTDGTQVAIQKTTFTMRFT
jgi:hypothetical protein